MKILKSLLLILVTLFLCTGCSGDNFNSTIMLVTPTYSILPCRPGS